MEPCTLWQYHLSFVVFVLLLFKLFTVAPLLGVGVYICRSMGNKENMRMGNKVSMHDNMSEYKISKNMPYNNVLNLKIPVFIFIKKCM